jgi:hypothetical protein
VHADASNFVSNMSKQEAYTQVLDAARGLFYDQRNWVSLAFCFSSICPHRSIAPYALPARRSATTYAVSISSYTLLGNIHVHQITRGNESSSSKNANVPTLGLVNATTIPSIHPFARLTHPATSPTPPLSSGTLFTLYQSPHPTLIGLASTLSILLTHHPNSSLDPSKAK